MKSLQSKKYKALIVDVDGTLVSTFHGLPSERVTDAIKKASQKLHVGLATSRPLSFSHQIIDHLKLSGPSIFGNGAEIVDSTTKNILYEQPIDLTDMEKIINILITENVQALVNEDGIDIDFKKGATYKKPLDVWIIKLTPTKKQKVLNKLSKIPTIFYWHSVSRLGGFDIVITHASATKQHGILEVAKILKIDTHEIIGIGDGPNDFPLLMACGFRVAMGNASDDLKAIADYVAPPVTEDGVADVIEKFIL